MRLSVERAEMRLPVTLEVLEMVWTLKSVSVGNCSCFQVR